MPRAKTQTEEPDPINGQIGGFEDISMSREEVPDLTHMETGDYYLTCYRAELETTSQSSKTPGAPMCVWSLRGLDNTFPLRERIVLPLATDTPEAKDAKVRRLRTFCEAFGIKVNSISEVVAAIQEGMFNDLTSKVPASISFTEDPEYGPQNNIRGWRF